MIFPYKIADEISKIANNFQTKNKFDENSTWCTLKYPNHKIQNKKLKSFWKIIKLGSFFDFHTKRPKLQNRGMQLLAAIHGFGGWNFAGDMIMNHIIHFLLLQLDLTLPKHPSLYPTAQLRNTKNYRRGSHNTYGEEFWKCWKLVIFRNNVWLILNMVS